ncbi:MULTISPECIES: DUF6069 family protein [Nonomuraea]|uniref:DUF6069 family protein n=2 Tax=Nonomuraea TaxID=83681 RepID=A0ABT4T8D3_9ACTN|nr:DUF6069 family protein [Nonomuraea ferruginea]MDA0645774.1 DUF6069 family protein [Nonomuraea ferruginea]
MTRRLPTIAVAVAATLAVWLVAVPIAGVDLAARGGAGTIAVGPVAVVIATAVAGLAGWALLAVLERLTRRARAIWTAVAAAVLVLSLLGPLGGVNAGSQLTLALMHLAAGAVIIFGMRGTATRSHGVPANSRAHT